MNVAERSLLNSTYSEHELDNSFSALSVPGSPTALTAKMVVIITIITWVRYVRNIMSSLYMFCLRNTTLSLLIILRHTF